MSGELINMDGLGNALIYIADKIGLTVNQMYDIYVNAQATMAILQIVMVIICVLAMIVSGIVVYIYFKKNGSSCDDSILASIILAIVIGGITTVIMVALYNPLLAYMCPEYTALKSLVYDMTNIANVLK
jgi:cytochrome b subunit of formate dehydrogenase